MDCGLNMGCSKKEGWCLGYMNLPVLILPLGTERCTSMCFLGDGVSFSLLLLLLLTLDCTETVSTTTGPFVKLSSDVTDTFPIKIVSDDKSDSLATESSSYTVNGFFSGRSDAKMSRPSI